MAIGGSYSGSHFTAERPQNLEFQQYMMYWDTHSPFSKGRTGVQGVQSGGSPHTRSGVHLMQVNTPMSGAPRMTASPVNLLANPRNLSFGGRNYGNQSLNRNEFNTLGNAANAMAGGIKRASRRGQVVQKKLTAGLSSNNVGTTPVNSPTLSPGQPSPSIVGRWFQANQARRAQTTLAQRNAGLQAQASSLEEQMQANRVQRETLMGLPNPGGPTPHPLASSNWREEQAHRITMLALGEPGQPEPDVTLNSRIYQQKREEERAARAQERAAQESVGTGGAPPPPGNESLTSAQRMANAAARIRIQQAGRTEPTGPLPQAVPNRPVPTIGIPAPKVTPGMVQSPVEWARSKGYGGRWDGEPTPESTAPVTQASPTPTSSSPAPAPVVPPAPVTPVGGQMDRLASEGVVSPVAEPTTGGYEMGSKTLGKTLGKTRGKSLTKPISGGSTSPSRTPSGGTSAQQPRRKS